MKNVFTLKQTLMFIALTLLGITSNLNAQVTLIKPDASTTSFPTISAAYAAIDFSTNVGAHTIQLESSYVSSAETYPLILGAKTSASATNSVLIKPATGVTATISRPTSTKYFTGDYDKAVSTTVINNVSSTTSLANGMTVGYLDNTAKANNFTTTISSFTANTVTLGAAGTNTLTAGSSFFACPTAGTQTLVLDNAQYVTINGTSRTGTTQIIIENLDIVGSNALQFKNGASNNKIINCTVKGSSIIGTSASTTASSGINGVILIGVTPGTAGNDNNTIENCDIRDAAAGFPSQGITLSSNSGSLTNDGNVIKNCNIYNIVNLVNQTNCGIYIQGNSHTTSITGTHIYWTAPFTPYQVTFFGIASSGNNSIIQNNVIGYSAADATGTSSFLQNATAGFNFYGMQVNGTATVSGNIIGGITGYCNNFRGIYMRNGANTYSANIIKDIDLSLTASGTLTGMTTNSGSSVAITVSGNKVYNLSVAKGSAFGFGATIKGIEHSQAANATITGNEVHDFIAGNNGSSQAYTAIGIDLTANTGNNAIEKNFVYSLNATNNTTTALVYGIKTAGGNGTGTVVRNNIVRLGTDVSTNTLIYGIYQGAATATTNPFKYYHNTVFIGGTAPASATNSSFAFYRTGVVPVNDVRNNIFANKRVVGGTESHFALSVAAATDLATCDYNIYQFTGNFGAIGTTATYSDLAAWQNVTTGSGKDAASTVADPKFVDALAASPDMHLSSGSPADNNTLAVVLVSDDFYGSTRSSLSPTDIGAVAYYNPNAVETPKNGIHDIFTTSNSIVICGTNGQNISIYNMSGQLVKGIISNSDKLNVPATKGFYIVSIGNEKTKVLVK
jgi:hypothetical protein